MRELLAGPTADERSGSYPGRGGVLSPQGHTVVFNVQIESYGECWCVPPPEGDVVEAWWGSNGALWLRVDGVDEGHTAQDQPPLGWGC